MSQLLAPDRYKQTDFFICDVFETFKDDSASMEHPIFSLSTKPDHRLLVYKNNGNTIKIKPSYTGLATIHDKDILLYLTSCLMAAKNNGGGISKRVQFTAYDYFISTNKTTDGKSYIQLKESLERLSGTRIETNIKTNKMEILTEFGLIDTWRIVKENREGRMVAVEVTLSDWFYNSVLGDAVLSIDRDYFRLRKPTERRLYELARKHCGNQQIWKICLDKLKDKLGSNSSVAKLRFNLHKLTKSNHLPEYNIMFDGDVVTFTRKEPPKNNIPSVLPKHVNDVQLNEFVRQNPVITKGKSVVEVREMASKSKQSLKGKAALDEMKKRVK